jgi:queuine tRNA-ribosyltransferase
LDECPPWPCEYEYAARSMELTARWAQRCKNWQKANARPTFNAQRTTEEAGEAAVSPANPKTAADTDATTETEHRQLLFGIVQGATFPELRRQSAMAAVEIGFDGYAIGGVSVGEPEEEMMLAVESSAPFLPEDKPRYAMGLGTPPQLLELIARGMDMFDCVLPTRLARNGTAFTATGTLNLKNAEFARDKNPIEPGCACPACREYSRGYTRHLVKAEEILGLRLITLHNLHVYLELMRQARNAIEGGCFNEFRSGFVSAYKTRNTDLLGETPA